MGEHPASCRDPECELTYVEHLRGFAVAAAATPNRRPETVRIDAKDAAFERDAPAYKALRRQGFQPRDIDGCHELQATAKDRHDIEGTPRVSPQLQELMT